jgi:hypothetical protein
MRSSASGSSIGGMKTVIKKRFSSRRRSAAFGLTETMSVASQMALLCPSGMDVWAQKQLAGAGPVRQSQGGRG